MRLPQLLLSVPFVLASAPAFSADDPANAANDICNTLGLHKKAVCECIAENWGNTPPVWDAFLVTYSQYLVKKGGNAANWQYDVDQMLAQQSLNVGPTAVQRIYDGMIDAFNAAAKDC